jgi:hypothetical protein
MRRRKGGHFIWPQPVMNRAVYKFSQPHEQLPQYKTSLNAVVNAIGPMSLQSGHFSIGVHKSRLIPCHVNNKYTELES